MTMTLEELLASIEALRLSLEGEIHWKFKTRKKLASAYQTLLLSLPNHV